MHAKNASSIMTLGALASRTGCLLSLRHRCAPCGLTCQGLLWQNQRHTNAGTRHQRVLAICWSSQQHASCTSLAAADISSSSNEYVKHCCKLRTSLKHRHACNKVLVVGTCLVEEIMSRLAEKDPLHIHTLLVAQGACAPAGIQADKTLTVTDNVMKKLCGFENTAGLQVVAEVDIPEPANLSPQKVKVHRLLALEGLQDPGNLGTLLRTAVAFGWDACFLLPGCCDPFNDKALKAGRGAAFKLPLAQGTWADLQHIIQQQSMQCLGAYPDRIQQHNAQQDWTVRGEGKHSSAREEAASVQSVSSGAVCLVLGSEGQGLSEEAMQRVRPVSIPMPGPMESLNVSQAGAILMFALSSAATQFIQRL